MLRLVRGPLAIAGRPAPALGVGRRRIRVRRLGIPGLRDPRSHELSTPQIETADLNWLLASGVATFAGAQRSAGIEPGDVVRASFGVSDMVAGARVGVSLAAAQGCDAGQGLVVELSGLSPLSIRVSDAARDDALIARHGLRTTRTCASCGAMRRPTRQRSPR